MVGPDRLEKQRDSSLINLTFRKLGTGFNSVLVTGNSQPAGTSGCDCDTVPMTLADATQDLMKDMGGGLWQDVMSSMNDWNAFVFGEPVDWSTVFANYDMAEPIYAQ